MLFLTQKKFQARLDAAIALVPKPGPDRTPELQALRDEIASLRGELASLASRPVPAIPAIPEPVDLTPLDERILNCELAVIQLGVKVVETTSTAKQTDDLATYLLESPAPEVKHVVAPAPAISVLPAFQGWVRPMGQ